MAERQMTGWTFGRNTCDRKDIWPKGIQPGRQKTERQMTERRPTNTRSSGHLAESTFDRRVYLAVQVSERNNYEQEIVSRIATFGLNI